MLRKSYFSSKHRIKTVAEQVDFLRLTFPGLGFANVKIAERKLPSDAMGLLALPRYEKIAPTYGKAMGKVLMLISAERKLELANLSLEKLGPQYLRQIPLTALMFQKINESQEGFDILLVPFGLGYGGWGNAYNVQESMDENEFCLDPFSVGIMSLTHPVEPDYLRDDFWINCAGCESSPDGNGEFNYTPFFRFERDYFYNRVGFDVMPKIFGIGGSTYAIGFLPNSA
ncbi:MAG: hypothetical protein HYV53_05140 [Parcubacteria group bacterium]|nr:hypothetical protein [Parcubacteria group bacterium]